MVVVVIRFRAVCYRVRGLIVSICLTGRFLAVSLYCFPIASIASLEVFVCDTAKNLPLKQLEKNGTPNSKANSSES